MSLAPHTPNFVSSFSIFRKQNRQIEKQTRILKNKNQTNKTEKQQEKHEYPQTHMPIHTRHRSIVKTDCHYHFIAMFL